LIAKRSSNTAASDVPWLLMRRETSKARTSCFDLAEGVLSIKRYWCQLNIVAAIVAFAIAAPMLTGQTTQSSAHSIPPAPSQSTTQAPPASTSSAQTPEGPPQAVRRTVTVTFNYDFSQYPPCAAKVTKKCIEQFNVWEVSAEKPIFLFTIPVPSGATGVVKDITGTSPTKRVFYTGPHRFGVSAKMPPPDGESNPYQCMVFAQVLPDNAAVPTQAPSSSSPQK
jgi:hypothetical protein